MPWSHLPQSHRRDVWPRLTLSLQRGDDGQLLQAASPGVAVRHILSPERAGGTSPSGLWSPHVAIPTTSRAGGMEKSPLSPERAVTAAPSTSTPLMVTKRPTRTPGRSVVAPGTAPKAPTGTGTRAAGHGGDVPPAAAPARRWLLAPDHLHATPDPIPPPPSPPHGWRDHRPT